MTDIVCGVDIAADKVDARIGLDGPWKTFPTTDEGLDALVAFCRDNGVTLAAMEATGAYERRSFAWLWAAGVPSAILNPRSVRRFAEAMGVLEKTDRIDCGMIAAFAAARRVKPTKPAAADQATLTALVVRLRQLTEARVVQLNQQRLVTEPAAQETFAPLVAAITAQIRALEGKITALIDADPLWAKLDAAFRAIKGVADRTTAGIMAELPEIGTLSNKAIAKLAGLAPIANDSGARSGRRPIRGGRARVRSLLVIVAEIVRRHDPDFQAFHKRLLAAGKPKMVVRVALAHKLLTRLNAKAREIRAQAHAPA